MADSHDGPPLLRPIPRRPFDLSLTGPTPPDEDVQSPPTPDRSQGALNLDSINSRLLTPKEKAGMESNNGSGSISRAQSILNLTSSTLFGIYAPTAGLRGRNYQDQDEPSTPWGTGAETPARTMSMDFPQERTPITRRRSSQHPPQRPPPLSRPATVFYIGSRALLLFGLGILYGALVARFQDGQDLSKLQIEHILPLTASDYIYMTFWGVSGVVLGGLMPWFDGVWEGIQGQEDAVDMSSDHPMGGEAKESETGTDWALAVRGIGAFVGIVFAIRKLPWASTLQVSLALAFVNPFLWYLIDRSKPGFLLSAGLSLTGSAILMGLNPDMVPTPTRPLPFGTFASNSTASADPVGSRMLLGGLASQETIETGIWMLSVLFCCCVCFGNIGRRLALNRSSSIKGRWAENKSQ